MDEKTKEVLEMIQKPVVEYIQSLLKRAGMEIGKEGAENLLSNLGTFILKKKLTEAALTPSKEINI